MQKSILVCIFALSLCLTASAAGADGNGSTRSTLPTNGTAENHSVDKSHNSTGSNGPTNSTLPNNRTADNHTVNKSHNSTGNKTHEIHEGVEVFNDWMNGAKNNAKVPPTTEEPNCSLEMFTTRRGFDGASFVGGIVLALGLLAIGFMGLKYYKTRTERAFHAL